MTQLFYTERGFCSDLLYEATSSRRHLRKRLTLPDDIRAGGRLFLLGTPFQGSRLPLHIRCNDALLQIEPVDKPYLNWQTLPIAREHLRPGVNTIEIWSDNQALDGWAIGMESGYRPSGSWLSIDGGHTWQNERMGVSHALSGEYLIRLRLDDPALQDPEIPSFLWEDRESELLSMVREVIPPAIQQVADPWERARALAAWVSTQWEYCNTLSGIEYAPWDALTILAWGRAKRGLVRPKPTVMCVHYGIVFVICALALGIPARSVCCNQVYNEGHFISEVWMERWSKWCQVDANCDVVFMRDGVPLSVAELSQIGDGAKALAVIGPEYERQSDFIQKFIDDMMLSGKVYEHWGVWPRNDFLSHPEMAPPAHGSTVYTETDWLWGEPSKGAEALDVFPYHASAMELGAAPPLEWREAETVARK